MHGTSAKMFDGRAHFSLTYPTFILATVSTWGGIGDRFFQILVQLSFALDAHGKNKREVESNTAKPIDQFIVIT